MVMRRYFRFASQANGPHVYSPNELKRLDELLRRTGEMKCWAKHFEIHVPVTEFVSQ